MSNRIRQFIFLLAGISVIIEGLFIKTLWQAFNPPATMIFTGISLGLFVYFLVIAFLLLGKTGEMKEAILENKHYHASGLVILNHVPKLIAGILALAEDAVFYIIKGLLTGVNVVFQTGYSIERTHLILYPALVFSVLLFFIILYGIVAGRFRFTVHKIPFTLLNSKNESNPLRLVQFSDLHIGSFKKYKKQVNQAIQKINSLNADLVCFTGDLVNIFAEESDEFIEDLKEIKAPKGKYAILGNHDYGEYYPWPSKQAQEKNLEQLKENIQKAGFVLLQNEHIVVSHNKSQFVLAGVENWGNPPFPQYGDINKALESIPDELPVLLLSHDPSHWDHLMQQGYDIRLTLSGHTHGMQFGIDTKWVKWSPVKFRYPRWTGMYQQGDNCLYVNRGLGFIGFPGRVGIWPEITLFEFT